jgi:hypothetical protein
VGGHCSGRVRPEIRTYLSFGYNAKVSGKTSEVLETSEVYAFTDSSALYPPASGKFDRAGVWQYTIPAIAGTGLLFLMMHADMVFVSVSFSRQTAGTCAATASLALSVPGTGNLE